MEKPSEIPEIPPITNPLTKEEKKISFGRIYEGMIEILDSHTKYLPQLIDKVKKEDENRKFWTKAQIRPFMTELTGIGSDIEDTAQELTVFSEASLLKEQGGILKQAADDIADLIEMSSEVEPYSPVKDFENLRQLLPFTMPVAKERFVQVKMQGAELAEASKQEAQTTKNKIAEKSKVEVEAEENKPSADKAAVSPAAETGISENVVQKSGAENETIENKTAEDKASADVLPNEPVTSEKQAEKPKEETKAGTEKKAEEKENKPEQTKKKRQPKTKVKQEDLTIELVNEGQSKAEQKQTGQKAEQKKEKKEPGTEEKPKKRKEEQAPESPYKNIKTLEDLYRVLNQNDVKVQWGRGERISWFNGRQTVKDIQGHMENFMAQSSTSEGRERTKYYVDSFVNKDLRDAVYSAFENAGLFKGAEIKGAEKIEERKEEQAGTETREKELYTFEDVETLEDLRRFLHQAQNLELEIDGGGGKKWFDNRSVAEVLRDRLPQFESDKNTPKGEQTIRDFISSFKSPEAREALYRSFINAGLLKPKVETPADEEITPSKQRQTPEERIRARKGDRIPTFKTDDEFKRWMDSARQKEAESLGRSFERGPMDSPELALIKYFKGVKSLSAFKERLFQIPEDYNLLRIFGGAKELNELTAEVHVKLDDVEFKLNKTRDLKHVNIESLLEQFPIGFQPALRLALNNEIDRNLNQAKPTTAKEADKPAAPRPPLTSAEIIENYRKLAVQKEKTGSKVAETAAKEPVPVVAEKEKRPASASDKIAQFRKFMRERFGKAPKADEGDKTS